jgi:hypothetical protein
MAKRHHGSAGTSLAGSQARWVRFMTSTAMVAVVALLVVGGGRPADAAGDRLLFGQAVAFLDADDYDAVEGCEDTPTLTVTGGGDTSDYEEAPTPILSEDLDQALFLYNYYVDETGADGFFDGGLPDDVFGYLEVYWSYEATAGDGGIEYATITAVVWECGDLVFDFTFLGDGPFDGDNPNWKISFWYLANTASSEVVTSNPVQLVQLSCSPDPVQVGAVVTCEITRGDPGIDILWRAAYNPTFAGAGVTLGADGTGSFSFVVPRAALGQQLTVELVEWTAPVSLGVVGAPVPASIPAGDGSSLPAGGFALLFALLGLTVRAAMRRSADVTA